MPAAFYASGLGLGIVATIVVSIICTHCAYILVVCAHELYKKAKKTHMSFPEVAEEACLRGPEWAREYAGVARTVVISSLFLAYFMTCSCYAVIVARHFDYVIDYYIGYELEIRITIAVAMVPLAMLACVPNLKYLAPFSTVANGCMAVALGITMYYLVADIPPISERRQVADISTFPTFISITIFAIEAIGVVMPLENNMGKPQHFIGLCGVLNQGMSGVTLVYIIVGFFGYLKYGSAIEGSVTLNLPIEDYATQAVNVLVGIAAFCTFGLQFTVCTDLTWGALKKRYEHKGPWAMYVVRIISVVLCVSLAVALPMIVPFVSLIGAFCFSFLGLVLPVIVEMLTFWEKGFGRFHWKIFKNIIVFITAMLALVFGSKSAIEDIVKLYTTESTVQLNSTLLLNSTLSLNSTVG
nr:proton-coupled amino acid transporter-like protein pathetic [Leptinotarsa decemlineata]